MKSMTAAPPSMPRRAPAVLVALTCVVAALPARGEDPSPRVLSMRNDIEPVLMKAGCNSGTCHGNARGQEGFRLSLFGFDPDLDHRTISRDLRARRVDPARPEASLLLQKATGAVTHGGGTRITPGDPLYHALRDWIASGAPNDATPPPALVGVDLAPAEALLKAGGASVQLSATARYADGSTRDVSSLAVYESLNDYSAVVAPLGLVTSKNAGEAFVMARFGTFAVVAQLIVVADQPFEWPASIAPSNFIDEAVFAKLRKLQMLPAERCSDEIFVRRAYLDVVGLLPTPAEFERFMADGAADKRARLIDELLGRPEFPELWAMKLAEILRVESTRLNTKGVEIYSAWLRDAVQQNVPLNQIARQLLTGTGGNYHVPPANFYIVESDPLLVAENVAQAFLGIRIQCAQCHNHPFERWTQDDYYAFAAFFPQIGRKRAEDPRETIVFNSASGEVTHPRTGKPARPKFLGGATPDIPPGADRRAVFADWLAAPENPWFARCFVNRVWAHFFGRGIIDPPDDVRVTNPASHPELLDALARQFVERNYDIRALVRDICASRTYQLSTVPHETAAHDRRNLAAATLRRLPAEQLLDAVSTATETAEKFAGLPLGARAVQVSDARSGSYFLETFGRPARQTPCTCERRDEPSLSQALHLMNGATVWDKIRSPAGRLTRLLNAQTPTERMIDELYVATLTRRPTDAECAAAATYLAAAGDTRKGLEDLFWALLNSNEFVFQH